MDGKHDIFTHTFTFGLTALLNILIIAATVGGAYTFLQSEVITTSREIKEIKVNVRETHQRLTELEALVKLQTDTIDKLTNKLDNHSDKLSDLQRYFHQK